MSSLNIGHWGVFLINGGAKWNPSNMLSDGNDTSYPVDQGSRNQGLILIHNPYRLKGVIIILPPKASLLIFWYQHVKKWYTN